MVLTASHTCSVCDPVSSAWLGLYCCVLISPSIDTRTCCVAIRSAQPSRAHCSVGGPVSSAWLGLYCCVLISPSLDGRTCCVAILSAQPSRAHCSVGGPVTSAWLRLYCRVLISQVLTRIPALGQSAEPCRTHCRCAAQPAAPGWGCSIVC